MMKKRDETLESLFQAAYPPNDPPAELSETLQRRLDEMAAEHDVREARPVGWRFPWRVAWAPAAAVALAVLLVALAVARWSERRHEAGQPGLVAVEPSVPGPHQEPSDERRATPKLPRRSIVLDHPPSPPGPLSPFRERGSDRMRPDGLPSPSIGRGAGGEGAFPPVDDLKRFNGDALAVARRWAFIGDDAQGRLEGRLRERIRVKDDFVQIPLPRIADLTGKQIAAAVEGYKREAAVVDARLFRKVPLAFKGAALSDLCEHLKNATGIVLAAGASVADEKVTIFCKEMPLRDVMCQLSRPFGYAWTRSGKVGEYKYELAQDLRSQLIDEELRERDRREALIALDREMQRYRPYLGLSPDEALALSKTARPEEKKRLQEMAREAWGAVQMYFRLTPRDMAAMRAGQELTFRAEPKPGEQPLPADLVPGVLQSWRDMRIQKNQEGDFDLHSTRNLPEGTTAESLGLPPAQVPEARPSVKLRLVQSEMGRFTLNGGSGIGVGGSGTTSIDDLADGVSPAARNPQNAEETRKLSENPALRARVSLRPQPSCHPATNDQRPTTNDDQEPTPGARSQEPGAGSRATQPKVTSADVLEALHRATGRPIVADFYTRLVPASSVSIKEQTLFDALNQLSDTLRMRWQKEGEWLQLRSASYYNDRLKEVPNRLLNRWAEARRQRGSLLLEDLLEIAQLSEAQLEGRDMAEGVRECFGLVEWDLACRGGLRPYTRLLTLLTPAQREKAQSASGLSFQEMSLVQQQEFLARVPKPGKGYALLSDQLAAASLRLEYSQPGWFRWAGTEELVGVGQTPLAPSPVRERTREAALQAARRLDPQAVAAQIAPSDLALRILYSLGNQRVGGGTRHICITMSGDTSRTNTFDPEEVAKQR